jgi:hypothetical protein
MHSEQLVTRPHFGTRHLTEKTGNMENIFSWYSHTIRKHLIVCKGKKFGKVWKK